MTWQLISSPDFDRLADAARDWYAEVAPEQVAFFESDLEQAAKAILDDPFLHRVRRGNWRAVKVGKFPYLMWYQVLAARNSVFVLGIYHQHRNPDIIAKRTHTD
ncbi:MAG: type II toxin-antitoxin system RelE/ParE family toxin [Propionibacteriaceae bacterium]|jgi:plasmid stabilization system protein ParE|nr:type II toxin-antitoxin system RelE/ParE family toxin [Propionibacteriaceae bacterium]